MGLMLAASSGSAAAVKTVLALGGVELEATDNDGVTAFLWACDQGKVQCITALAEVGCDTAARTSDGSTRLMLAASSGSVAAFVSCSAGGSAGAGQSRAGGDEQGRGHGVPLGVRPGQGAVHHSAGGGRM
eukprot:COSAG01_NODE_18842_length_1049_cov_1.884211_2_plen_130_part_00